MKEVSSCAVLWLGRHVIRSVHRTNSDSQQKQHVIVASRMVGTYWEQSRSEQVAADCLPMQTIPSHELCMRVSFIPYIWPLPFSPPHFQLERVDVVILNQCSIWCVVQLDREQFRHSLTQRKPSKLATRACGVAQCVSRRQCGRGGRERIIAHCWRVIAADCRQWPSNSAPVRSVASNIRPQLHRCTPTDSPLGGRQHGQLEACQRTRLDKCHHHIPARCVLCIARQHTVTAAFHSAWLSCSHRARLVVAEQWL